MRRAIATDGSRLRLTEHRGQYHLEDVYEKDYNGILCWTTRYAMNCGRSKTIADGIFTEYMTDALEMDGIRYTERPAY